MQENWDPKNSEFPQKYLDMMIRLADEPIVHDTLIHATHELPDTTTYFLKDVKRFLISQYKPSNEGKCLLD